MLGLNLGRARASAVGVFVLAMFGIATTSCGGGGGTGSGDTLPGLVLVDFMQNGQDNVPLNRTLEFLFSSPLDPNTVGPAGLQIREGPSFGQAVFGHYIVEGSRVMFEPHLPGLCDLSDAGFQADTDYRVSIIGSPEEFSIRSLTGDAMPGTISSTFHTRLDTDPELFEDQLPGVLPTVVSTSPVNGSQGVAVVHGGNLVTITFSENLDPCTVNDETVLFYQYEVGPFFPVDSTPSIPESWGGGSATTPPRRIRTSFDLHQDTLSTVLTLTPIFGEFPDNALLVVRMTSAIHDFGGNPLAAHAFSFTTENRPAQTGIHTMEFDGDVPVLGNISTAEVNTARSLSKVQGFVLFAGDGDNGTNLGIPAGPDTINGPLGCTPASFQPNDGFPDDFDPVGDTLLITGTSQGIVNQCKNATDGTTAVVFEFQSFRIRSGVNVRIAGVNPVIFLVRGVVNIESGASLIVRGDAVGGSPQGQGASGVGSNFTTKPAGGIGVAGGGSGGQADIDSASAVVYSFNGAPGFGSPDYGLSPGIGGNTPVRIGAGRGSTGTFFGAYGLPPTRIGPGGGGGGHADAGQPGGNGGVDGTNTYLMNTFADGAGGGTYGDISGKMPTAEAGSGGGGAGPSSGSPWSSSTGQVTFYGTGGAGGAGGGFVDLTTVADIRIFGTIDARGGRGGNGVGRTNNAFNGGSGGGGGGSGGGIRLLTPANIQLGAGAILTVAGGSGGASAALYAGSPQEVLNPGGMGAIGRLVLEDSDSVIQGLGGASLTPGDGQVGFYRGVFDTSRFKGGGLRPVAYTDLIDVGPFAPTFLTADQQYGVPTVPAPGTPRVDFIAGIPPVSSRGPGLTSIFIEAQGFPSFADGTANLAAPTGWKSVGYFTDSGAEPFPTWVANAAPGDVGSYGGILPGNTGNGFNQINGNQFVQFRFTFFLKTTMGPFDPGPYIDRWTWYYQYDQ